MFDKRMAITLFLGMLIILGIIFGDRVVENISSGKKISNLIENDSKAVSYYKKACDFQDGDVCNKLGDMYHTGKNVSLDYENAVEYYTKACELESGAGCNNLAFMLNRGLGIEKNNWSALKLYKKACKYGEIEACYNIGSMYYHGEGTKRNYYTAAKYFKKSCNRGVGAGCNDLAFMYENGKYLKRDLSEAISLYREACDLGEASGCNNVAYIYEKRNNDVTARGFYSKACDLGDIPSCNRLESVLGNKIRAIKGEVDLKEAQNACRVSTQGGTMCYRVGLYYEEHDEHEKARDYFEKACNRGQSQSCKHLGDLFS